MRRPRSVHFVFDIPCIVLTVTTCRVCSSQSMISWCAGPDNCRGSSDSPPLQDLTRVESGHETMFNEPFDLTSVITEATNLYKYEAQRKGLRFEVDLAGDLPMVVGDLRKIRTVVANLTANACKNPLLIFSFTDYY